MVVATQTRPRLTTAVARRLMIDGLSRTIDPGNARWANSTPRSSSRSELALDSHRPDVTRGWTTTLCGSIRAAPVILAVISGESRRWHARAQESPLLLALLPMPKALKHLSSGRPIQVRRVGCESIPRVHRCRQVLPTRRPPARRCSDRLPTRQTRPCGRQSWVDR